MHGRELIKITLQMAAIVALILVAGSCLSFDSCDPPSKYAFPLNEPPVNLVGLPGAYIAWYTLYYAGAGVFALICGLILILARDVFRSPVSQLPFRVVGLILLALSISAIIGSSDALNFSANSVPVGKAGVLGTFLADWLLKSTGPLGRFAIVSGMLIAGLLFISDTFVFRMIKQFVLFIASLFRVSEKKATKSRAAKAAKKEKPVKEKKPRVSLASRLATLFPARKTGQNLAASAVTDNVLPKKQFEINWDDNNPTEPVQLRADQPSGDYIEVIPDESAPKSVPLNRKGQPDAGEDKPKPQKVSVSRSNVKPTPDYRSYILPPINLLDEPERNFADKLEGMVREKAARLQETLDNFKIEATVINAEPGPTITMYEVELSAGIRLNKISVLAGDIARALAVQVVRVVSPIPGKDTIGIEVPNSERETVRLMDLIKRAGKVPVKMSVPIFLGKDSSGSVLVADLAEMPHGLIAGTTGSGKSVCINTIIISILLTRKPNEVKLILVDPKQIEMNMYEGLPHLMCPIVSDMNQTTKILEWAVGKMEERYAIFNEVKIKNIGEYNDLGAEEIYRRLDAQTPEEQLRVPKKMPYLVIIVDELSDLMMTNGKEVEEYIVRLTQKSRAAGIHVILATQRPQASVVTGLIKSNLPARISFKVASRLDSRIILDKQGAETLLGKGDMLYLHPKTSELIRAQGAYLSNQEIANVVNYIRSNASPDYSTELVQMSTVTTDGLDKDEFFDEAVRIVLEEKRGSVSLIQRKLAIGYGRASRIVEMMAECGILGGHKTAQAREVMITPEEWERIKGGEDIADIRRDALNSEYSSDEYEDEEIDLNEEDSIDED
ncbi:MAG: DNA translocase FtsK [Phycisphaerae bacterium]|jgi:S-DNA-T family DNA segregation ATPase FtsK/SpoIIIE